MVSKGTDSRVGREGSDRNDRDGRSEDRGRNSRTSTPMTVERARALHAHTDRTGTDQDVTARGMPAARNMADE